MLVGAKNESLQIILIYYMFKYLFGIKTTLLELLLELKKPIEKPDLVKTSYKDLVFTRSKFLKLVGAQNLNIRHIIIYYMFKY